MRQKERFEVRAFLVWWSTGVHQKRALTVSFVLTMTQQQSWRFVALAPETNEDKQPELHTLQERP